MGNKKRWHLLAWLLGSLVVLVLPGCTETDTYEGHEDLVHGHVQMYNQWSTSSDRPDSMMIMAVRIINYWKCGMMISTENLRGHYFYNYPYRLEPWIDPNASSKNPDENNIKVIIAPGEHFNGGEDPDVIYKEITNWLPTAYETELDHFNLPRGIYNFYTLTADPHDDFIYHHITDYLQAESTGLPVTDIYVDYIGHDIQENSLGGPGTGWTDNNPGYQYIRGNVSPIFTCSQEQVNIESRTKQTLRFAQEEVTQDVDVCVNIEKDLSETPFVVDSVWAELSGVPSGINVFNGYLINSKLHKVLFRMDITDNDGNVKTDLETNKKVQVRQRLHIPSILPGKNAKDQTGAGILQLAVYIHYNESANGVTQKRAYKLQATGNIYQTIKKAAPTTIAADKKHLVKKAPQISLTVPQTISMNVNEIKNNTQWTQNEILKLTVSAE